MTIHLRRAFLRRFPKILLPTVVFELVVRHEVSSMSHSSKDSDISLYFMFLSFNGTSILDHIQHFKSLLLS